MREEDHWIDLPAGRVFARCWRLAATQAAPIILFHDSLGCVELWRDFPAALAQATGRTVIAYDRPGFGRSAARADRLGNDFIAAEAEAVLPALRARLGLERFAALGHSVGGGMAAHAAAAYPTDCSALVTIAAQAFVEDRTLHGIRTAQAQFADAAQRTRLAKYHGDKARWVLEAWIQTWLDPSFATWTLDAVLPRIRCPVLAIHGADDEYGSPHHAQRIGALAGGPARVIVLPDTRHLPHRERPAQVLERIAEFLAPLA